MKKMKKMKKEKKKMKKKNKEEERTKKKKVGTFDRIASGTTSFSDGDTYDDDDDGNHDE